MRIDLLFSFFGLVILLNSQSFARTIKEICDIQTAEGTYCESCAKEVGSQARKMKAISQTSIALSDFLKTAGELNAKSYRSEAEALQLEQKVIEQMNGILEKTKRGKQVLTCFRDKSIPVSLKFRFANDRASTFKIGEVLTKFDSNLTKRNAAGLYRSEIPGDKELGIALPGDIKKVMLLNPTELDRPLNLLLVYAHEMQHGCHLHNKEGDHSLVNEYANFTSSPCAKFVFGGTPDKLCLAFKAKAMKANMAGIVDELKSFQVMFEIFKQLAEVSPEICSTPKRKSKIVEPSSAFWQGLDDATEGIFWSAVEKEFESGEFAVRTANFYAKREGYSREALFSTQNPRQLNRSFKSYLRGLGFKAP